MQVHDTPLVINAKGATVAVTVGAGGADVYYGASAATASRVNGGTLASAGSTFQVTAPTWVVRSDQSQAPAADLSFVEQAPSTSAGSAGSSGRTATTAASSATPTIATVSGVTVFELTAQAVDITSFTTNLTGTPARGDMLLIAITGTAARAIAWGASFESGPTSLPTTTVTTNRLDVVFIWNVATSKWRCLSAG